MKPLAAGKYDVTSYPLPHTSTAATTPGQNTADWYVLVLFADDSETNVKGLWGPYSTFDIACAAMGELREWPIDGYWDIRRLNKFVALKTGTTPPESQPRAFTWQSNSA